MENGQSMISYKLCVFATKDNMISYIIRERISLWRTHNLWFYPSSLLQTFFWKSLISVWIATVIIFFSPSKTAPEDQQPVDHRARRRRPPRGRPGGAGDPPAADAPGTRRPGASGSPTRIQTVAGIAGGRARPNGAGGSASDDALLYIIYNWTSRQRPSGSCVHT